MLTPDTAWEQVQWHNVRLLPIVAAILVVLNVLVKWINSPLKHIPGPWLPAISSWPLFIQALRGKRATWIKSQHETHGQVIRIAPNKVSVSAGEGTKLIYSNKAAKSHAYDAFCFRDVKMCIGLREVKEAHTRRKALLPAFSRHNLIEMEPVIRMHLERFLDWLKKFEDEGKTVDVFKWFRYLTFDVITDIAFGQQIGMLKAEDTHFVTQIELRNKRNALIGPFPFLLPIMKMLRLKLADEWINADEEIAKYAIRARDGWKKANATHHRVDILARLEEVPKNSPDAALSDQEIIAEMMEILNAGSDTTANTAMFTTWELAAHPKIQDRLHQELVEAFPDNTKPLDIETLERLPFLEGVINEGLRLHAPIPSFLERIAPTEGLEIAGYQIPAGTIVGMQAYTNHRDASVYAQPRSFIPERWLDVSPAMKLNFMPFSAGPRACIGLNLANMQLRIHLGHIFRRYRVAPGPQTTADSMKHAEFFTIRPRSGKCELYFHQV